MEACDKVRKAERRAETRMRDWLEQTNWMCFKIWANWTEKKVKMWQSMSMKRFVTGIAYRMGLVHQRLCQRMDAKEGRKLFRYWCA